VKDKTLLDYIAAAAAVAAASGVVPRSVMYRERAPAGKTSHEETLKPFFLLLLLLLLLLYINSIHNTHCNN
jgi:uncharacterized membrane protein YoaK (UPF0700 family)